MSKILAVTGITGHSGRFFLKELEENNFNGTVRCLVRKASDIRLLEVSPLTVEIIYGNYNSQNDLKKLTENANMIMHISNIHQSVEVLRA